LATRSDALGDTTTYQYDAGGRKTCMVDPNDASGNCASGAHAWLYAYDKEDRLTSAKTPPVGGSVLETKYTYDAVGNRTVLTDPNGQVSMYTYDARDALAEVQQSATGHAATWDTTSPPSDVI